MTPEEREAFHDTRKEDCEASLISLFERGRAASLTELTLMQTAELTLMQTAQLTVMQRLLAVYGSARRSMIYERSGAISEELQALQAEVNDYAKMLGLDAPTVAEDWEMVRHG